jgi:hypothetical protein
MKILKVLVMFGMVLSVSGCKKPEVNFDEMFTEPTATIQGNTLVITGGAHRLASAYYVLPRARIDQDTIYVYGVMSLFGSAITNHISLAHTRPAGGWNIKWVNKDGTMIDMKKQ